MRVLSIDLDYIMGPVIELYNEVGYQADPVSRWKNLFDNTAFKESHFYIDQGNLIYCYDLFLEAMDKCSSVSFGYEHDAILHYIGDKEDLEIINIDHHDDMFHAHYSNLEEDLDDDEILMREYEDLKNGYTPNEGNWGAWLHAMGKLKSFTWIGNKTSANVDRSNFITENLMGKNYRATTREDFHIFNTEFDHIFVCCSPQYMPKNHWHYFTMFILAYEIFSKKEVDKTVLDKKYSIEKSHQNLTDEIFGSLS